MNFSKLQIGLILLVVIILGVIGVANYLIDEQLYDFTYDVKSAYFESIDRSVNTGEPSLITATARRGDNIDAREVFSYFGYSSWQLPYFEEFYTTDHPTISIEKIECTDVCDSDGKSAEFVSQVNVNVQSACTKIELNSIACNVLISKADKEPEKQTQISTSKSDSALQRNLKGVINPKILAITTRIEKIKNANPIEKTLQFYTGKSYAAQLEYNTIMLLRIYPVIGVDIPKNRYYYQAAQKYGLIYPDGSLTADEFIDNVKTNFAPKLLLDNSYPEFELLVNFDASSSQAEKVQRAMRIYEITNVTKKANLNNVILNQVKWLNQTNNTNVNEYFPLNTGEYSLQNAQDYTKVDLKVKRKNEITQQTVMPLKFTVNAKFVSIAVNTTKNCNETTCEYKTTLTDR